MTLNLISAYRRENPHHHITYLCHPSISKHLRWILLAAGVDQIQSSDDKFNGDEVFRLTGYPIHEGYPEKPMQDHLVRYFARDLGIRDLSNQNLFDNFKVADPIRQVEGRYCTVHVQAGWSPYKNWPVERWEAVCREIGPYIKIIQIGGPDDVRLQHVDDHWTGKSFKENLDLFAYSDFHLGVDSWSNHASNIIWKKGKTKSLILWGSTQSTAAGYPHNLNIQIGLPCQPCFREDPKISRASRGICPNPRGQTYERPQHQCMQDISVEMVLSKLIELLAPNP